ncbi:hypothetical protein [Nannocystis bainbridge]|uniref:Uncharacterized protein n=1 Tax=Nannocystis bainbridge TaxID=2995303 RepID=A0ABT5DSI5_9BACT|nr:hypothetical protein [Nannocystis bainbridge]MDC0716098.1 hypothetical protein [Nannocystis bainbridge]
MTAASPPRPEHVPASATYDPESAQWREDSETVVRRWYRDGQPLLDANLRAGKLHGAVEWVTNHPEFNYGEEPRRAAIALQQQYGLPIGPSLTTRIEAVYEDGAIVRATFHGYPFGAVALVASWRGGRLHGRFDWLKITEGEILRFGDTVIGAHDVKLPKPHPHRGVSEFVDGKRKSTAFFDRDGQEIVQPKPIKAWGQEATPASLPGYVARGEFERDLAAFFPNGRRVTELAADSRPLAQWIDRLPEGHRAAARAFDALVRSGRFPWLGQRFDVSGTYGFDCVKQGLAGAADERYVGLSADGSGNMHLLDTTTGRVLGYEHESDSFDAERGFADLDAFAFAMPRVEAAASKRIPAKKLAELFKALGLTGGLAELG